MTLLTRLNCNIHTHAYSLAMGSTIQELEYRIQHCLKFSRSTALSKPSVLVCFFKMGRDA